MPNVEQQLQSKMVFFTELLSAGNCDLLNHHALSCAMTIIVKLAERHNSAWLSLQGSGSE